MVLSAALGNSGCSSVREGEQKVRGALLLEHSTPPHPEYCHSPFLVPLKNSPVESPALRVSIGWPQQGAESYPSPGHSAPCLLLISTMPTVPLTSRFHLLAKAEVLHGSNMVVTVLLSPWDTPISSPKELRC